MDVKAHEILRRAIPLGLANMSVALMPLIDSVMLGQHDVFSMASGGLAMQIYLILFMLGEGIVFGFGPIYGRYMDADDRRKMASSKLAVYFLLAAFAIIAFLILLMGPDILLSLQQSPRLIDESREYLVLLGLSILPNLLFIHYWEMLAFHDKGKLVVIGATIQLVTNIALNYILIYGKFGAPELGLLGAGIGTFIGSLVGAGVLLLYVHMYTNSPKIHALSDILSFRTSLMPHINEVLKLGLPIGLSIISTVAFLSASVFLMGWYSEEPLAAHIAVLQINEVIVVFILGFNEYCAIHVSSNIGTATSRSLRAFLLKVTATSFGFITLMLVVMYALRFQIYALFLGPATEITQPIYGYMDDFLSFSFPFLLVDAFLLLITGILRGCEITSWPLILNLIGFWVFGFFSQMLLISYYPTAPIVVWIGMQIGFLATAIGVSAYFIKCSASFSGSLRSI
ncbi:MAG: polysaccharide biosynthesis C-terminal domain-containing protein [Pseudomonadaceae bacterium]|nr:polysaccharide biosynthesis C-terminal domain-containing protein [Pseudomonadaceae bacterium]